ncbi:MAG TPA: PHP domain-containing protein [Actinomycetota bacterium]|jgi:predicted metal-dependent phosphoesterase TrpH
MPGIDLHTHSDRSDGTFTPSEVVRHAAERGLDVVALTDHDTTAGIEEALAAGRELGVEVVPGVEFSAEHLGTSVHVLCYWMDVEDASLQEELGRLRDDRFRRGELMVSKLRELGFDVSFDRVREIAQGGNIVRPHVAQAMVEAGIVASEEEAFDRWIADGRPAHVPKHALAPIDALPLIREAGGLCVLAHPGMWGDQSEVPEDLIEAMAGAGMAGLEVDHTDHDPEQRARYRALADRFGVIATGGSDCHGTRYEPIRLGTSRCAPEAFAALRELAGR